MIYPFFFFGYFLCIFFYPACCLMFLEAVFTIILYCLSGFKTATSLFTLVVLCFTVFICLGFTCFGHFKYLSPHNYTVSFPPPLRVSALLLWPHPSRWAFNLFVYFFRSKRRTRIQWREWKKILRWCTCDCSFKITNSSVNKDHTCREHVVSSVSY